MSTALVIVRSALLFLSAGLAEIGGGYLIWVWLRDHKGLILGLLAIPVLYSYGFLQALQPAQFGRVFAAYGGVFIVMSVLWGWFVDGRQPDRYDFLGAGVAVLGAVIIMGWPRG